MHYVLNHTRFAWDRLDYYISAGEPLPEACRLLARDLGHGDSRARYVKMVYCRETIDRLLTRLAK